MLDAAHFRQRAACARELAQSGEDIRLSRMLLDVASDLDAEAEAIETELANQLRAFSHSGRAAVPAALLSVTGADGETG